MKFGYTIIYVANVEETVEFYEKAFEFTLSFMHESKKYAELNTGNTTLAFAAEELAAANGIQFKSNNINELTAGFEIAFICENVATAYQQACNNGATSVQQPSQKPWGQKVAYIRDNNGVIIELCSPMK